MESINFIFVFLVPSYIGCFNDDSVRDLPFLTYHTGTIESCIYICSNYGYSYAGTQNGYNPLRLKTFVSS